MRGPGVVFGLSSLRLFYYVSLSLAQGSRETLYQLDVFTQQKPCAQSCFTGGGGGCVVDFLGASIGCRDSDCTGAPDKCFCRLDLQPIGQSYLTSCVKASCTLGQSSIDISSAGSIYNFYCSSKGYITTEAAPTATPAPTTSAVAPAQASTTTEIVTATASSTSASSSQEIATTSLAISVEPPPAVVTTRSTTTVPAAKSSNTQSRSGLNGGEIAGIVVGIIGAILTAVGVYIAWKMLKVQKGVSQEVHHGTELRNEVRMATNSISPWSRSHRYT